jgi:hypothetical protein
MEAVGHGSRRRWGTCIPGLIAAQNPKFAVMMIGLNDRKQIREAA